MPRPAPLHNAEALGQILTDTIGKAVTVKKIALPNLSNMTSLGLYNNDDGSIAYVVLLDLSAAANLGVALTWIPPGAADDMVDDGELSPLAKDNVVEVLNICTRLVHDINGAHVKCTTFHVKGDSTVDEIKEVIASMSARLNVEVAIADYKGGKMSFVAIRD